MTPKMHLLIPAAALIGLALGCSRDRYDDDTHASSTTSSEQTILQPATHTLASGWAQSSAAEPLGWADRAERRVAEFDFAHGVDTAVVPPNAIGGGPSSFDPDEEE